MSDYTVSCDAGNGQVNAVLATRQGYNRVSFPSIRALVTGDSLGLGNQEMQVDYIEWNAKRYVVGDDVLDIARRRMEKHQGKRRYGDEVHQSLVAAALARLGVKSGTVRLTVFAPPGIYREVKNETITRFMEGDGTVTIRLKSDKKARHWQYEQVTVYPEGMGAAACFVLDDSGEFIANDALDGEILVLDLGLYTADCLLLSNGAFNPESLAHTTWETGGLDLHVRQPVLEQVKKHGDDFTHLTTNDVDRVIRAGYDDGQWMLKTAGYEIDLQPTITQAAEAYAGWIANTVIDSAFDGLRGIRSMILVGGGAILAREHLMKWYDPEKLMDTKKHPMTKKIHPTDFNAVGGLRLSLMKQKQEA